MPEGNFVIVFNFVEQLLLLFSCNFFVEKSLFRENNILATVHLLTIYDNYREEAKADEAAAVAAKVNEAEARKWEECVEGGEAYYVTAMLASVVRSLAEGPKTEVELDQVWPSTIV